ncbi:MAG: pirin family protein, partial [Flavobacteriales bacterium]|nr:pirin family protein [Flavobacteriales bacterium]
LLPFRRKRQVGPFTFIDHMGPSTIGPNRYMDVDQHPHIGLCTLTYLLEGEVEHRDSTGAVKVIKPGDVGLMTAGKGVSHTERTPSYQRNGASYAVHGYQVWIALPIEKEEMEPRFDFIGVDSLPSWEGDDLKMTLIAGSGYQRKSPLPVHSDLFMLEVQASEDTVLRIQGELQGELAIVVTDGRVEAGKEKVEAGQMLISMTDDHCELGLEKNTRLLLFGGPAFPEERFLHWNFVSHSKERLKKAVDDWSAKRFPEVPGDVTYIPSPPIRII